MKPPRKRILVPGGGFGGVCAALRPEKLLAANPQLRVSEVAYEVGFQSLTHFNRVLRKILGQSPAEYRRKVQNRDKAVVS